MDPEIYLTNRQFLYNRKVVVTDILSFIDDNTTTKPFTFDDFFCYLRIIFYLQLAYLSIFCLHYVVLFIVEFVFFLSQILTLILNEIRNKIQFRWRR